ncbi:type I-E CRISPR-associated protein Cse1/CasA [Atlantibacter hermannii]|uniref:type I-E CRISPR-associated protein Cse1/CasA n=1 Tax=Atlantibacter hermannii TaxID=565 RepID=UPI002DBEB464|nr:type I-E CRISPR-associated protein Cse1/CasA [Atlantibacter hermannii]MEB7925937.1 type I-E CRISPR-associated protein Cse1/CasA [Atlantibacter hermannii]
MRRSNVVRSKPSVTLPALSADHCLAKTWTDKGGISHPGRSVYEHSLIVGSVARELTDSFPAALRQRLIKQGSSLLAACHDVGKISPSFYLRLHIALNRPFTDFEETLLATLGVHRSAEAIRNFESGWSGHSGVSALTLMALNGLYYSEGISHHNYKEGHYDPSVLINKKGKELKVQWTDPARRPWRELPALLAFIQAEKQSGYECEQLRIGINKARIAQREFGVWSGGLRVSSNAGEQYVSGTDDIVESLYLIDPSLFGEVWFYHFNSEMDELDKLARRLYGCVSGWCREMKLESKDIAAQATEMFWHLCEQQVQALLDGSDDPACRDLLRKRFAAYLH